MEIPSLYLDTSVLGGYFDEEFQGATRELWRQWKAGKYRFVTSMVVDRELVGAPEIVRNLYGEIFQATAMLQLDEEAQELAREYLDAGVVTQRYRDDANHVAICTVARLDYLVSWNFRHLVNVDRANGFHSVNILRGYPLVRIVNPLELIYGNEEEDI